MLWLRENLCWGCSWGGRAAVQMLSAPGEAPGASGPASVLSFSSSSAWCAEKTPRVFGRGSGELRQPQRGFGKGTARWRCYPGVAVSPRAANVTQLGEAAGALSRAPCAGFGKREREEEFILSSCQSITSQRLLRLPLVASSPRCAQCWRLQNSPCPGRGITASPKSHH